MVEMTPKADHDIVFLRDFEVGTEMKMKGGALTELVRGQQDIARLVRDDRQGVYSIIPKGFSLSTYYNYLVRMCFEIISMPTTKSKQIDALRTFGYIPLVFTPQPDTYKVGERIAERATELGLPVHRTYAWRVGRSDRCIDGYDYWVFRMDAADLLGCEPKDALADALFLKVVKDIDFSRPR